MMLPTDLVLLQDKSFMKWVRICLMPLTVLSLIVGGAYSMPLHVMYVSVSHFVSSRVDLFYICSTQVDVYAKDGARFNQDFAKAFQTLEVRLLEIVRSRILWG